MKRILAIILTIIMLCSTGCRNSKQEKIGFTSPNNISGYELADFDKFNSPASENGLGGTKVYIDGIFESIFDVNNCIFGRLKSGDHKWCINLSTTAETAINDLMFLSDKNVRIFGVYLGFSDTLQMPAVTCLKFTLSKTGESYSILEFTSTFGPMFKTYEETAGSTSNTSVSLTKESNIIHESGIILCEDFINKFSEKTSINLTPVSNLPSDDVTDYVYCYSEDNIDFKIEVIEDNSSKQLKSANILFNGPIDFDILFTFFNLIDNTVTSDDDVTNIYNQLLQSAANSPDANIGHFDNNNITYDCYIISEDRTSIGLYINK